MQDHEIQHQIAIADKAINSKDFDPVADCYSSRIGPVLIQAHEVANRRFFIARRLSIMKKLGLAMSMTSVLATGTTGLLADESVTVDTFVRAESDIMIRANMSMLGVEIGKLVDLREPTTPKNQPVIRMNQDTLYSGTVIDLSKPVMTGRHLMS